MSRSGNDSDGSVLSFNSSDGSDEDVAGISGDADQRLQLRVCDGEAAADTAAAACSAADTAAAADAAGNVSDNDSDDAVQCFDTTDSSDDEERTAVSRGAEMRQWGCDTMRQQDAGHVQTAPASAAAPCTRQVFLAALPELKGMNPYVSDGALTFGSCKWQIRKNCRVGDYVIIYGGAGADGPGSVHCVFEVEQKMPYAMYMRVCRHREDALYKPDGYLSNFVVNGRQKRRHRLLGLRGARRRQVHQGAVRHPPPCVPQLPA